MSTRSSPRIQTRLTRLVAKVNKGLCCHICGQICHASEIARLQFRQFFSARAVASRALQTCRGDKVYPLLLSLSNDSSPAAVAIAAGAMMMIEWAFSRLCFRYYNFFIINLKNTRLSQFSLRANSLPRTSHQRVCGPKHPFICIIWTHTRCGFHVWR